MLTRSLILQAPCDGAVGSICSRCQRLELKVDEKTRTQAKEWLAKVEAALSPQLLAEPTAELLSLPKIMMFELGPLPLTYFPSPLRKVLIWPCAVESQLLLVHLREEVDRVSGLARENSLQRLFGGNLLCHVDDKAAFDPYSTTSSTIAIRRLATTVAAANEAPGIVAPALDGVQLDTFIDRRRPRRKVDDIADIDVSSPQPSLLVGYQVKKLCPTCRYLVLQLTLTRGAL